MSRAFSLSKIALLKSQINALGLLIRLLEHEDVPRQAAAKELQRIQCSLRVLSMTPKKSQL